MTVTENLGETHHSIRSKCCLTQALKQSRHWSVAWSMKLLVADHISIRCCFSSSTSVIGFWWTCSCVSLSVGVSRLWCTGMVFVQPGMKVNGAYCCDVLLLKQFLPEICQAAGDFFFLAHNSTDTGLHTRHLVFQQTRPQSSRVQDMDSHSGMRLSETARDVKRRQWAVIIKRWTYYIS